MASKPTKPAASARSSKKTPAAKKKAPGGRKKTATKTAATPTKRRQPAIRPLAEKAVKATQKAAPLPSAMDVMNFVVSKGGKRLTAAKKMVTQAAGDLRKLVKKRPKK
jgi:hypothetical protein